VTVNFQIPLSPKSPEPPTELAVSQVVFTVATQNGANTGVIFEIDGQRTSVPISSGATVFGPVYYFQFTRRRLRPRSRRLLPIPERQTANGKRQTANGKRQTI